MIQYLKFTILSLTFLQNVKHVLSYCYYLFYKDYDRASSV